MEVHDELVMAKETVAVIGLGFVGLPLSVMLAEKGFHVTGIDVDNSKINKIMNFQSYIGDIDNSRLKKVVNNGWLHPTSNFDEIRAVKNIIICVPTPLTNDKKPDIQFILKAGKEIQKRLQSGQLIILESSTFPGTTKEILLPILEESGLKVGTDFFLANSPERIDPGNSKYSVDEIPKVIGGITNKCKEVAVSFYRKVYKTVVPVTSAEAAEFTKLLENTFRFVNISFINEMAILCEQLKIDIWEVIEAASTKPYGFTPFYPGPGIGGHCIPVDPLYLQWKLKQLDTTSEFISISSQTNERIIEHITSRVEKILNPTSLSSAKILIYGVTYKKDVADTRDSTAIEVMKQLRQKGADVQYHDPYVPLLNIAGDIYASKDMTEDLLREMDCVIILTDHAVIPLEQIVTHARIVFDTKNVTKGLNESSLIVRLGEGSIDL
ncbi:nucleotide sugar dehydrogenase [Bacillus carboniphilus]|uniref:Nucleotide sugar dehydrogenase n=1 Tax=Bacillus carboniphilus TaxID=86663 RepID=A0ABP3FZN7_9BACI